VAASCKGDRFPASECTRMFWKVAGPSASQAGSEASEKGKYAFTWRIERGAVSVLLHSAAMTALARLSLKLVLSCIRSR
jgi:hypothetical protein